MIRFHALPFDSMRFDSILCEDFIIFSKTKKKAGISNGHFKLMNDDFVVSHVPRPVSHRSRARIALFVRSWPWIAPFQAWNVRS